MGEAIGFDPFEDEFWEGLFAAGSPLGEYVRQNALFTAIAGALVLALWVGAYWLVFGVPLISFGFRMRSWESTRWQTAGYPLTRTDAVR